MDIESTQRLTEFLGNVGFPIFSAIGAGYFLFLALKYILNDVVTTIEDLHTHVFSIEKKIKNSTKYVNYLDVSVSEIIGVKSDILTQIQQTDEC